jgi:lactate dehydrogenase-like 2-hydroxyacid dehydrogenase
MKIVVDENMPHAVELFAEFGEVVPLPGREIRAADLQEADVLLVRSVTRVNEALLASCPRLGFVGTATIGTDHIDQGLRTIVIYILRLPLHSKKATVSGRKTRMISSSLSGPRKAGYVDREYSIRNSRHLIKISVHL